MLSGVVEMSFAITFLGLTLYLLHSEGGLLAFVLLEIFKHFFLEPLHTHRRRKI